MEEKNTKPISEDIRRIKISKQTIQDTELPKDDDCSVEECDLAAMDISSPIAEPEPKSPDSHIDSQSPSTSDTVEDTSSIPSMTEESSSEQESNVEDHVEVTLALLDINLDNVISEHDQTILQLYAAFGADVELLSAVLFKEPGKMITEDSQRTSAQELFDYMSHLEKTFVLDIDGNQKIETSDYSLIDVYFNSVKTYDDFKVLFDSHTDVLLGNDAVRSDAAELFYYLEQISGKEVGGSIDLGKPIKINKLMIECASGNSFDPVTGQSGPVFCTTNSAM